MKKSENFPWSRTSNFYFDVKSVDVFESSANNDVTQSFVLSSIALTKG